MESDPNLSLELVHRQKRGFRIVSLLMFDIGKFHLLLVTGQFGQEGQNLHHRRFLTGVTKSIKLCFSGENHQIRKPIRDSR